MKIQVFGGSGFVGSEFTRQNPGCLVNARDDYSVKEKNILYMISTVTNYHVKTNPYIDIDTNLTTLMKVLEQIKNNMLQAEDGYVLNFISSWFVYGETEMPAHEESNCYPNGFYSITKRCAEQLLISYCETFGIKYRILRLANVAGHGDKKASPQKNALQHMINELKAGRDVNVYDGGNLYRDYIHVSDVTRAIKLIMETGEVNTTYNVGNGQPLLFKDMIEYAKELIGGEGRLVPIEIPQFHRTVQVRSMWMLSDKLKSLGYAPNYNMKAIIEDMVK